MMTDVPLKRSAIPGDAVGILAPYKNVSLTEGGLARKEEEITASYVSHFTEKAVENGIQLVALHEEKIIAEIHCYKSSPQVFDHVLSDLTIAVDPQYQGKGIGKKLFRALLSEVENNRHDIYRVELISRESNIAAIGLYLELGFVIEGRMEKRIKSMGSGYEADVPMAWFNKNYKDADGNT